MVTDLDEDALSRAEQSALERVRTASTLLDEAVTIPGINYSVGIDPLLGALPVSGDAVGAVFSLYIVAEAARLGVPVKKLAKMVANIGIDVVTGSIPVAGTLVDAAWKANVRNVSLLEDHLAEDASGE